MSLKRPSLIELLLDPYKALVCLALLSLLPRVDCFFRASVGKREMGERKWGLAQWIESEVQD